MTTRNIFRYTLLVLLSAILMPYYACKPNPTTPTFREMFSGIIPTAVPSTTTTPTTSSHAFVKQWGTFGSAVGQFKSPHAIAVDDALKMYISDYGNNRVQVFTSEGIPTTQWVSPLPQGIAVDNGGNVYVAEELTNAIKQYTTSGLAIQTISPAGYAVTWVDGTPATQVCNWVFRGPMGLALDDNGNRWVTGTEVATSVCQFPNDFVNVVIQSYFMPDVYQIWFTEASDSSQFVAVALDQTNDNAYFVDAGNSEIHRIPITALGDPAIVMGGLGSGNGQFHSPHGIAVGRLGHVFVADTTNFRIQEFDADLVYVTQWGSEGTGPGQFENPWGVTVDKNGYIYVADTDNHRIQKFAP